MNMYVHPYVHKYVYMCVLFYMYECFTYIYACLLHACIVSMKPRRGHLNSLELELQITVSQHVSFRTQPWSLSKASSVLNH